MSEWISVEDRVPMPLDFQLAYNGSAVFIAAPLVEGSDVWISFSSTGDRINNVTHWMPLPAPPQPLPEELERP